MTIVSESEPRPDPSKGRISTVNVIACVEPTCERLEVLQSLSQMDGRAEAIKHGWRFRGNRWHCPDCHKALTARGQL